MSLFRCLFCDKITLSRTISFGGFFPLETPVKKKSPALLCILVHIMTVCSGSQLQMDGANVNKIIKGERGMGIIVFSGLFLFLICFSGFMYAWGHYQETKLKKAIISARSAKQVSTHFTVQESTPVRLLLCVFTLLVIALFFGLLFQGELHSLSAILGVLILLSGTFYMVVYCHVRKITVSEQTIHYRSILKNTAFLFEEITKVRFGLSFCLIIYCADERMFAVERNCAGYYDLLTRLIFEGVYFENPPKL